MARNGGWWDDAADLVNLSTFKCIVERIPRQETQDSELWEWKKLFLKITN